MTSLLDMLNPQMQPVPGGLLGTIGPASAPTLAPVTASTTPLLAPQPGFFGRLERTLLGAPAFGAPDAYGGMLGPQDEASARRAGLLNIGLSLLANSAPQNGHNAPPTLAALAQAIQAGRQGFQQQRLQALQEKSTGSQLAKQQQLDTALSGLTPPGADATSADLQQYVARLATTYAQHGFADEAGRMGTLAAALRQASGQPGGSTLSPDDATAYAKQFPALPASASPEQQRADIAKRVDWLALHGYNELATQVAKEMPGYATAENPILAQQANERIGISGQNSQANIQQKFLGDVKTLKDKGEMVKEAMTALNDAKTNPAAFASAYSKYVQAVDQNTNLRYQLLQYYEHNVDPSFTGTIDKMVQKIARGKIPPGLLSLMQQHVQQMGKLYATQFQQRRNDWQQRFPDIAFPTTENYFPGITPETQTPSGPAPINGLLGAPRDSTSRPPLGDIFR